MSYIVLPERCHSALVPPKASDLKSGWPLLVMVVLILLTGCHKARPPAPRPVARRPSSTSGAETPHSVLFSQLTKTAVVQDEPLSPPEDTMWAKARERVCIDQVGNATMMAKFRFHTRDYMRLKGKIPHVRVFLRKIGLDQDWADVQPDVHGGFDDDTNTLTVSYSIRGFARMRGQDSWEAQVDERQQALEWVKRDNPVTFTGALQTPFGLVTTRGDVELPPGTLDIQVLKSPLRLAFRMPASHQHAGKNPAANFSLDLKPQVMTCLAKSYGNPKFASLWLARAVFKNTGDQTLKDYRVRFRLVDFTSTWTEEYCKEVVPGQTVVDPYFPIFDVDRVAKLESPIPARLEVEYEYQQANGQKIHKSLAKRTELLGKNVAIFSSMPDKEAVDFYDSTDNAKWILASFVRHNDPVIHQVAGWVSGQAGGAASSLDDNEAFKFLRALYDFMVGNKIAYKTSAGGRFGGQFAQHVYYPREVLHYKAGTCIDLAIFYASVCQAVGLQPKLCLTDGHCFPVIKMPKGGVVAVETTGIGQKDFTFKDAVNAGNNQRKEIFLGITGAEFDIQQLQDEGVYGLDLLPLPDNALNEWGIKRMESKVVPPVRKVAPRPVQRVPVVERKLVGTWQANYMDSSGLNCVAQLQLRPNRTFAGTHACLDIPLLSLSGRYTYADDLLTLRYTNGWFEKDSITWLSKNKITCEVLESNVPEAMGLELTFTRLR